METTAASLVIVLTCVKLKKIERLVVMSIYDYVYVSMSLYLAHQDFTFLTTVDRAPN